MHAKFGVDWCSGVACIDETKVWGKHGSTESRTEGRKDGRKDGGHFIVPLFFNAGDNKKTRGLVAQLPHIAYSY